MKFSKTEKKDTKLPNWFSGYFGKTEFQMVFERHCIVAMAAVGVYAFYDNSFSKMTNHCSSDQYG